MNRTANWEERRTGTIPLIGSARAIRTLDWRISCTSVRTVVPRVHTLRMTTGFNEHAAGGHAVLSGRALHVKVIVRIDSERTRVHVDDDVVVQIQLAILAVVRNTGTLFR